MTWFKVDDTFYAHPKVVALEAGPCCYEAISLWVLAGSWSAGQLTDGEIPSSLVRKLGFKPRVAQELIRVGLWRETDHGYAFHEWSNYQPTREEVENRRHATKERVSRHRNGVTNASRNSVQTSAGDGVSNAAPVPSRPDLRSPHTPQGVGPTRCATPGPERETANLVAAAIRCEAHARQLEPAPLVPKGDLRRTAERVDALVRDGVAPDALTAATALVRAAFALGDGPKQRPLRFALLEATVSGPNGHSAQSRHKPPEDPWV